jgi:hypothetical protein
MPRDLLVGLAAGAIGTVALNVATYLDMLARGRPPSDLPANVAGEIVERAGIAEGVVERRAEQHTYSRLTGAGALLGYASGLGLGGAYGIVRPHARWVPLPAAGALLGLAAMASSDIPATTLGVTDPREWGAAGWLSDIVPHAAYGIVTALAFEALRAE